MSLNLLIKEWRLGAHPNLIIFMLMGPLVLVPAYPLSMIWLFLTIGVFISFTYNRETGDLTYTANLPVSRNQLVLGKFLLVGSAQIISLVVTTIFIVVRQLLQYHQNPVGLNANVMLLAVGFLFAAGFNLTFMPAFFKAPRRVGHAYLLSMPILLVLALVTEALPHFPGLYWLAATGVTQWQQVPWLMVAILIYGVATGWSLHRCQSYFSKVDL
jgi:hypothetical protein